MSRRKKNAGQGYGMMFHGAFGSKSDAKKKERQAHGFIKRTKIGGKTRYVVMSERKNPVKRKKKNPLPAAAAVELFDISTREKKNPSELLVMGANPHGQEITLPAGSTLTIRMNPATNLQENFTVRKPFSGGRSLFGPGLIRTPRQRRVASMVRKRRSAGMITDAEYKRLKKSARKGPASKVFHELYGRNPSAAALHEKFTGREPEFISISNEPHMPQGDYAKLGAIMGVAIKPISGGQVQQIVYYNPPTMPLMEAAASLRPLHNPPWLVSDESARQMYFYGGDQDISSALAIFGARPRGDELVELGELRLVVYRERKWTDEQELMNYVHKMGEESGVRPTVLFDPQSKRLLLEGGEYRIERAGIIN
jgi:hypothetical protein